MITRPLDLSSRLRAVPRSFDALFWVNVGALVLFFGLFGSRFVLAPGLGVDFYLPELGGAKGGSVRTTHVISMVRSGLIFTDDGALPLEQIGGWLDGVRRMDDELVSGDDGSADDVRRAARAAEPSSPEGLSPKAPAFERVLLVRAGAGISVADLAAVTSAAQAHGFRVQIAALEPEPSGGRVGEGTGGPSNE